MSEPIRRVKLYRAGKLWVAAAVVTFGVGVATGVGQVAGWQAQTVQAADDATIVTTTDDDGNISIDPEHTAGDAVAITDENMAQYFTVSDLAGNLKTISGREVSLTTGKEKPLPNLNFTTGTVLLLANRQVDFTSDFALSVTMHVAYDNSLGTWVGGDGTALFFEPLSVNDVIEDAEIGSGLGIAYADYVDSGNLISFNISSNAEGRVTAPDGTKYTPARWLVYSSSATISKSVLQKTAPAYALDTPIETNQIAGKEGETVKRVDMAYTFDMKYDAKGHTITTNVLDGAGKLVQTWKFPVPAAWRGKGYTMGVSAATAMSHAQFDAKINSYSYTPAGSSLNISSTGLPEGVNGPKQSGIKASAGNTVAFYPEGTQAPTTAEDGRPLTAAYAVPAVGDYGLAATQYATIVTGDDNNVVLPFVKQSKINVKYVDQNGKEIQPSTTLTGNVGTPYSVTRPTIEGYTEDGLGKDSPGLAGKFIEEDQTVTLQYKQNAGSLTIKYEDEAGHEIADPIVKEGSVGEAYQVDERKINGYDFDKLADNSAALKGTLTAEPQTVILQYKQTAGGLTVKYEDEAGHEIADPTVEEGSVGEAYQVEERKIDGYKFDKLKDDSAALEGTLTAEPQTVILQYKQNAGSLTVKYEDEAGHEIADPIVKDGSVGEAYQVDERQIDGYKFDKLADNSAELKGTLTAEPQTVILQYKQNAGSLTVKYEDEAGHEIADPTVEEGSVGEAYQVEERKIDGYKFDKLKDDSAALEGTLTAEPQTVILQYKQNAGSLTVKYEDEAGHEIADPIVKEGSVGEAYQVDEHHPIPGYGFEKLKDGSAALEGTLTVDAQTVTLVYHKLSSEVPNPVDAGPLTIHYVDEYGAIIKSDETKAGNVGNGYAIVPPEIGGYTYTELGKDSAPLTGQFTKDPTNITLVYNQNEHKLPDPVAASLTIHYVDEYGATIKHDETKTGNVGNGYAIVPPEIGGYTYTELGKDSAPLTGQFTKDPTNITLVYNQNEHKLPDPVAASLTIHYVDEYGATIKSDETKAGNVGNSYTVVPPKIGGYRYGELGKDSAPLTGQFTKDPTNITLVYNQNEHKLPDPVAASLTIHYVDEYGATIKHDETKTGNVGNGYAIEPPKIGGYQYGELGKDSASLTGVFTKDPTNITLVYNQNEHKLPDPVAASLTIHYVDEYGATIKHDETKTGNVGNGYAIEPPKIGGYQYGELGKDSASLTGVFTKDPTNITLVYNQNEHKLPDPVAASLTIHYVDEYGATIKHDETKTGNVGNGYAIEPPKIGGYQYGELGKDSASLTGVFTKDPTNITLVYNQNEHKLPDPVAASLTIHYVDEYGATIKSDEVKAGNVGNGYAIEPPKIGGYQYGELGKDSAPLTGQFTKDPTNITLVYNQNEHKLPDPVAASLTIHYVDEYGATIKSDETKAGNVGNGYAIEPPKIGGYHYGELGKDSAPLTGVFTKDPTNITLVYNQNEHKLPDPVAASLTIHYVDEYGATIKSDEVKAGNVGNGYAIEPPKIGGYHYGELGKDSASLTGVFTKDPTNITLVYNQNEHKLPDPVAASLTIHYVDDHGVPVALDETKQGNIGNGYTVVPKPIGGYTYTELGKNSAPLTGKFVAQPTDITLVYHAKPSQVPEPIKAGELRIHFVDIDGKPLGNDIVKTGSVGNGYTVAPIVIDGYRYVGLADESAPLTGTLSAEPQTITLLYRPVPVTNTGTGVPGGPVDNGGNPPSTPVDNGGNPPSTPVDNGGTAPSTPVDNSGNPPSTPVDNSGNPPSTPADNGGTAPSTPVDNGGNPPSTPIDNGGTAPSTPVDNGGNPPSTPVDNSGNPPSTPVDNGGNPPSTPIDNGGTAPSTPIDNGGNPLITPVDNGGNPPSTPIDNGGTAPSTPVNNGGTAPSTPVDNGGNPPSTPVDNGGNPPSTPIDNANSTQTPNGAANTVTTTPTRLQAQSAQPAARTMLPDTDAEATPTSAGKAAVQQPSRKAAVQQPSRKATRQALPQTGDHAASMLALLGAFLLGIVGLTEARRDE
ncbi:MucBP domain-containing protein [Lacticaseibacillus jixiensis]|uniref:MucBP domain-containing protein n=1 Tax=Lacticaseibacillus jixiensis TaxID=3231926 RepID=UPI0036F2197B